MTLPLTPERMDLLTAAGNLLQVARILDRLGRANMAATMRAYAQQLNIELGIVESAADPRFEHDDERRG